MAKFFVCIMLVSPQQQYQLTWIFLHLSSLPPSVRDSANLYDVCVLVIYLCFLCLSLLFGHNSTLPHFPTFCFLRSLQHELFSSFSYWHFYVASLAMKNDNECFFSLFFSLSSPNIYTIGKTSSVCEFCKSSLSIFCYCHFSSTYHHPLQQVGEMSEMGIEPKPNPYLNAIFHGGNYAVTPFSLFY